MLLLTQNAYPSSGGQQQAMIIRDVCPQCQSSTYKKNGHIHNGKQNHQCKACGRQFVACFEQYLVSEDTRALIERLLVERSRCVASVAPWVSSSSGSWQGYSVFEHNADKGQCLIRLSCQLAPRFGDIAVSRQPQQPNGSIA